MSSLALTVSIAVVLALIGMVEMGRKIVGVLVKMSTTVLDEEEEEERKREVVEIPMMERNREMIVVVVLASVVDGTRGSRVLVTLTVIVEVGEMVGATTLLVFTSTSPDPNPDSGPIIPSSIPLLGRGSKRRKRRPRKKVLSGSKQ